MKKLYQYYVEGEDEKRLIDSLKKDLMCITSGKVEVFNIIQNTISKSRIRTLQSDVRVVLVYDTDVDKTEILEKNISILKADKRIKQVICIPQVYNLEDELERACDIKNAKEITGSKTKKDFKTDLIHCTNLHKHLKNCRFDISKFWSEVPDNAFYRFGNESEKVKGK